MSKTIALKTINRDDWGTPQPLFDWADDIWGPFTLDVAATPENTMCTDYLGDGLSQPWRTPGSVWCNPPYGRGIASWLGKACAEYIESPKTKIVMLLPARTDTRWFGRYAPLANCLFITGRVKFSGASNSAPFPSMFLVFGSPDGQGMSGITLTKEQRGY